MSFIFGMQGKVYVEHIYYVYVNLVEIGLVVFKIWEVEISNILVAVNNTLCYARLSWPHNTLPCVLMLNVDNIFSALIVFVL